MERWLIGAAVAAVVLILAVAGGLLRPAPVDVDGLRTTIDAIASEYVQVGVMISVIARDQTRLAFSYGSTTLAGSIPPDENTLFDIGSITKSFTGALLAESELRGLVDLETPVRDLLPSGEVTLPTFDGIEIELIHLATHTSGLPRGPQELGFRHPEGCDSRNWYAAYTTEDIYEYLTVFCELEFAPATRCARRSPEAGGLNRQPRLSSITPVDARRGATGASPQDAREEAIYREEIVVPDDVIDGNGHVNNVAYVQWMQDIAVRHFTAIGGIDLMHAVGGTWVVRSHRVEYLAAAFAGDRIRASTWVADARRVRSLRRYEFMRPSDGAVLARGETDWVFVDTESGRPCAIPASIRRAFTIVPDGKEGG